jgi:hypothetical protein
MKSYIMTKYCETLHHSTIGDWPIGEILPRLPPKLIDYLFPGTVHLDQVLALIGLTN